MRVPRIGRHLTVWKDLSCEVGNGARAMACQRMMKLRNREPHLLVRVGSATNRDPPRAPSCLPLTSVHRPITLTAVGLKRGDHWLFTQVPSVIISCPEKLVSDTSIIPVGACETSGQHGRCDPHASLCNAKSPDESRSLSGQPTETERREIMISYTVHISTTRKLLLARPPSGRL